jgi:DinB superfamily
MTTRPERGEASPYYFTYIDLVPDGDICEMLDAQGRHTLDLLRGISETHSLHRYAPDKWSIRDVVNHVSDTERLFVFRAFWFARGFESPLPSFDQTVAVTSARADDRSWQSLVDEFRATRAATVPFFRSLPPEAWAHRGIASDNPFTVRALAFLAVGHVTHHSRILRERYLGHK